MLKTSAAKSNSIVRPHDVCTGSGCLGCYRLRLYIKFSILSSSFGSFVVIYFRSNEILNIISNKQICDLLAILPK